MTEPKRPNSLVFNEAMLKGFMNGTLEPAVEEKIASLLEARPDLLEKISAKSGDGFLKRLREVQQRSSERSPTQVKAEVVAPAPVNKAATKSDDSIPEALANYAGYKIIKELGRGGMGVVYLAKNIQMDRLEVLKVLNERLLNHSGAKERFLREIRAVSKLSHTNIVTSYSILPLDNLLVFAMEYVHGIDLHQYTHKFKPMSVGLACSFAKQIAAGLEHAHEKRLVHRDIKPSNVIIYKSGGQLQLKILDFGLAKATSEEAAKGAGLTQDGTMLGTPEYMSPEQTLNAAQADIRADIYSLGCTLYYMLTGKPPFTGTHGAVLLAHSQREPTVLNLIRPDVPTELVAVVGKMLAKDLRKRYQTPSEVASALSPFVNQSRSAANQSPGAAAVTNTVNALNGPDRETSVEAPLSELSLDTNNQAAEPQQDLAALAGSLKAKRAAPQSQPNVLRTKTKQRFPKWFIPTVATLGALILFFTVWQLASFTFKTPNGTIIFENMPADAEVLVDGKKMEIVWNAGRDKAEVSINAGTHQLRVLNQGNEIYGDKVSIKGGDLTVVKLSLVESTLPSPEMSPKSIEYVTLGPVDREERSSPGKVDASAPREFTETPSGLKYRILRQGNGKKPTEKSDVVVHYKGWLDNQTVFDSTYRKGESNPFSLTSVIKGWTEGMPLISEGGMIELNIPPALGYGSKGTPGGPIPPNADLHFIIELTAVNTNAVNELDFDRVKPIENMKNPPNSSNSVASPNSITNSIGMKFVLLSAGTFMMGSPTTEKDRDTEEVLHRVTLTKDYYLGTTEVTQSQWESLMGTTPWKDKSNVKEGSNFPASYVSWEDAVEFCTKLSAKEGKTYRLPTEAEWEYACRGGTTTAYSFGDGAESLSDFGWWGGNVGDGNAKSEQYAHEVGLKRANGFGLFDMHGNLYEWCADWKDKYPNPKRPVTDPLGHTGDLRSRRICRGGSWVNDAGSCRAAARSNSTPDSRRGAQGFRVAADR